MYLQPKLLDKLFRSSAVFTIEHYNVYSFHAKRLTVRICCRDPCSSWSLECGLSSHASAEYSTLRIQIATITLELHSDLYFLFLFSLKNLLY